MKLIKTIFTFILSKIRSSYALKSETESILRKAYVDGSINVVYDIGAHRGLWTTHMHKRVLPNANFILFEANPIHSEYLKSLNFPYYISALTANETGDVDFYSTDDLAGSTGGSIYKENTSHYEAIQARKIKATTLNILVDRHNLPIPDFIKIDTQGAEIDVIEGGIEIFKRAKFILIELPILEYNQGAPTFDTYNNKLAELGFYPVSISEIHKFGSVIIQLDFLFVNKILLSEKELNGLNLKK